MAKKQGSSHVVLITGGSGGVGQAAIKKFKDLGYQVCTCSSQKKWIGKMGADLEILCDLSLKEDIKELVKKCLEKFKRLDVLINNAGYIASENFEESGSEEVWIKTHEINLFAPYYLSKACLPELKKSQGSILNVSSILGLKASASALSYSTSKHALIGLSKSLALLAAPYGVRVNSLCPGWIDTPMAKERMKDLKISKEKATAALPLKKILKPSDVVDLMIYLLSESGKNITGQALVMDGGSLLL